MTERALATIRKIAEVQPIPNADAIEAVRVDGWWVVAKKGEFPVNSLAVYLEIDSWVPTSIAPFLTKAGHEPKEFESVKGERLRTIKLRGQVSQGLLLPLDVVVVLTETPKELMTESDDVTEILGILKYEKPLPAALAGTAKGNFPSFIPKTDQPRIQNCTRQFEDWKNQNVFYLSRKANMTKVIRYSSNNSGGSWWLSDNDWKTLEKAGWVVQWAEERWLNALATSAYRVGLSYDEAVAEFERVTGECADSEGCECCGQPHFFYEDEINE